LTAIWLLSSSTGFQGTTHNPQRGFKESYLTGAPTSRRPVALLSTSTVQSKQLWAEEAFARPHGYYPRQEPRRSLDAAWHFVSVLPALAPRLAPSRRALHFAYVSGVGTSVEVREAMFAPPLTPSTSTSAPSRADPSHPPLCLCFRRWCVRKGERKQCSLLLPPPPEASPHGPPCRGCLMLLVPNNTRFWLFNFFSAGSLYWKLIYPSLQSRTLYARPGKKRGPSSGVCLHLLCLSSATVASDSIAHTRDAPAALTGLR
jgi:hypothetical protein